MNTPAKILIVEDEIPLRHALVDKLTREGFAVTQAANGEEGLMEIQKETPDLILLDVIMPRMDGLTMLQRLREQEGGKDIHVIMLTNLGDTAKVADSLDQEAFDFLVKSDWKLEDVVAKIRSVLKT